VKGNLLALISGFFWRSRLWAQMDGCGGWGARIAGGRGGERKPHGVSGRPPSGIALGPHAPVDWAVIIYLGVFQIALAYVLVTAALASTSRRSRRR